MRQRWSLSSRPQWTLCGLGILFFLPFLGILLGGNGNVLGNIQGDASSLFYFVTGFTGRSLGTGFFPFWNPYIMLGCPFLAEGEGFVFHPFSLIFALFPLNFAYNLTIALSCVSSGLAFYGYLRASGVHLRASACGAVSWGFSNVLLSRIYAGHIGVLFAVSLIPFLFLLWEKWRHSQDLFWLPLASLTYACMIFAGYPQATYYTSLLLLLYGVLQCAPPWGSRSVAWRAMKTGAFFGIAILLGIGVAGIQILPTLDYAAESFRSKSSLEFCGSFSFAPENIFTLLCPTFFGSETASGVGEYWGRNYWWEMVMYIGILPLVAAITGMFCAPRRQRGVLVICVIVSFVLALGIHTPLFPLLYRYVPLFDTFRGSGKFSFLTIFCLATLAGYGFEIWFEPRAPRQKRLSSVRLGLGVAIALLVCIVLVMGFFVPGCAEMGSHWQSLLRWRYAQGESYDAPLKFNDPLVLQQTGMYSMAGLFHTMIFLLLVAGLFFLLWKRTAQVRRFLFPFACVLVVMDLGMFFVSKMDAFNSRDIFLPNELLQALPKRTEPVRLLDVTMRPNLATHYGFSTMTGYSANTLVRYNNFINRSQGTPLTGSQACATVGTVHPVFRMLALEYLFLPLNKISDSVKTVARTKDGRALIEYPNRSPRVFLATAPRKCLEAQEAFDYIFDDKADLLAAPAIETQGNLPSGDVALAPEESVAITAFSPNRVEVQVRAQQPRVMVLDEMYEKNWVVRVNGALAPVLPANYIFRSVVVPAGESTVVFTYESPAFRKGVVLSGVSLLIVLLLAGFFVWRRRVLMDKVDA